MSASGAVYTRESGSFIEDGFAIGMEVRASGFTQSNANGYGNVTDVADLTLTVDRALATDDAADDRILVVGLPAHRGWENVAFEATVGRAHVEESYTPARARRSRLDRTASSRSNHCTS